MERKGAMPLFLAQLSPEVDLKLQLMLMRMLLIMTRGSDISREELGSVGGIPRVLRYLQQPPETLAAQLAAQVVLQLSKGRRCDLQLLIEEGGVPPLVACLRVSSHHPVCINAAQALHALTQLDSACKVVSNEGGVKKLLEIAGVDQLGPATPACVLALYNLVGHASLKEDFAAASAARMLLPLLSQEMAAHSQQNFETALK
eukprot:gene25235-10881_t